MSSKQAPALMRKGVLLVSGSAFVWSIDGAIWRFLRVHDSWTVVFWRSTFEALFPLLDSMYFVVSPFDFDC